MQAKSIKNALDAHGWVGLYISVPLFVVFWAGAVTFFYAEVQHWASMPRLPIVSEHKKSLNEIVQANLDPYQVDQSRRLTIRLPSEHDPYLGLSVPVLEDSDDAQRENGDQSWVFLMLDPHSGRLLADNAPFQFAQFMNQLHYTLKIPEGGYVVGFVSFFFLVTVVTGVLVQLKKLLNHFFLYRHDKSLRYRMNDLHNVVGGISLPYGVLYALTGVMFNLGILFQIPTMFLLYDGNQDRMFEDAGFANVQAELVGTARPLPDLDLLISELEAQGVEIESIRITNYGDESAVVRFHGHGDNEDFVDSVDRFYEVGAGGFPDRLNPDGDNRFIKGVSLLYSIHMADFAGLDVRFVFFLLAIAVCAMIIAGNALWIAKRQKKNKHPITMKVARGLSFGGCVGVVVATAVGFLLERSLPTDQGARADVVAVAFGLTLCVWMVYAFFMSNFRRFIGVSSIIVASILAATVSVDILLFRSDIMRLWGEGYYQVGGVTIALSLCCVIFVFLGKKLLAKPE